MDKIEDLKMELELSKNNLNQGKKRREFLVEQTELMANLIEYQDKSNDMLIRRIDTINKYFERLDEIALENDCVKILTLKLEGKTNEEIALEVGVHRNTVANKLNKLNKILQIEE